MKTSYSDVNFDVVVIGGGPAGVSSALQLAKRGVSVALVERSLEQEGRMGETIHPTIKPYLQNMGLWERFCLDQHLPSYGNRSAWGDCLLKETQFIFTPYGTGWHLNRDKFDMMLTDSAKQAGVRVFTGRIVRLLHKCSSGRWLIQLNGEYETMSARMVIDATGRTSKGDSSSRTQRMRVDNLIGIRGIMSIKPGMLRDLYTLTESVEDGWWYSAFVPSGQLVIYFFTDADIAKDKGYLSIEGWTSGLQKTLYTKLRSSFCLTGGKLKIRTAASSCLTKIVDENWLAVGDAACAFDPLSSFGIQKGLNMGEKAALAVTDYLQSGSFSFLQKYENDVRRSYRDYLVQWTKYYSMEQRWGNSKFWERRHYSDLSNEILD